MAEQGQVAAEDSGYDRRDVKDASGELCGKNLGNAGSCAIALLACIIVIGIWYNATYVVPIVSVVGVVCLAFVVFFMLLAFCMYHNQRGEPHCHWKFLERFLKWIPSMLTSIMATLQVLTARRRWINRIPVPVVHDIEQGGIQIPENRDPDEDPDQGAVPVNPDVPELQEMQNEEAGPPPIVINYEGSDDSESDKAGPSNLREESSSSVSSLNIITPDSIPTDSIPIVTKKATLTCSDVSEQASGSISDGTRSFSDELLEQDTSDRQSLRGRAIGDEQVASACPTSEEIFQLGQNGGGGENATSARQSSESLSIPEQMDKAETVESSEELRKIRKRTESEP